MSNSQSVVPPATRRVRLAIFASGGGSNAEAIIHYSYRSSAHFCVALVVSNNSRAVALERAEMFGVPTAHISGKTHPVAEEFARAILENLQRYDIEMIALAGYMKKLPDAVVRAFSPRGKSRIFNIHPSLLPKYGGHEMYGLNVHKAVIANGETVSGCTAHEVEGDYDTGMIIAQKEEPVLPNDTPETLAARILRLEHDLYPEVLNNKAFEILQGLL
jgi:phosphoribosylglycinamide formyltransferase-1